MQRINNLTNSPRQTFTYNVDGGNTITFTLYFYSVVKSWFFDFTYNDYTCNGERVVLTWNALRHLKNILPFGVAFLGDSKAEPYSVDDFSTGRISMYILSSDEVQEVESEEYYQ